MEHTRERVRQLAQHVMAGGADTWPTILLYTLDYLVGDELREVLGLSESAGDGRTRWQITGCTDLAVVSVAGTVDAGGQLDGPLEAHLRRLSDLRSVTLLAVEEFDDRMQLLNVDTRASWRLDFATGESLELSTIGVNSTHQRDQTEAIVAFVLERAGLRSTRAESSPGVDL